MIQWARENVQPSFKILINAFTEAEKTRLGVGADKKVIASVAKPKATDSAWAKIDGDYHANYLRLIDAVRASVIYKSIDDMRDGICAFKTWLSAYATEKVADCSIVQLKDNTAKPGYKDFNLSFQCNYIKDKVKSPYIAELQFHVCNFIMAKQGSVGTIRNILKIREGLAKWDAVKTQTPIPLWDLDMNGHGMYEKFRVIKDETSPIRADYDARMTWLYSDVAMGSAAAIEACNVKEAPKFDKFGDEDYWEEDA